LHDCPYAQTGSTDHQAFTVPSRKRRDFGGIVPYRRGVTMSWCPGMRLVVRLLEGRVAGRGRDEATVVRHQATGCDLRFESEQEARRFLQRYCCEPPAFEIACADDEGARSRAA
jgi:hypothetical protein